MNAPFSLDLLQRLLRTDAVGRCVLHLPSVSSTMDAAREEAETDAPHGMIVIADEQTRGQGRRGRRWISPPGNVYVTIILRPQPWEARSLAMVAPLAVCEAVDTLAGVRSSIKWPNDVLIGGRKVAGVLIDTHLSGGNVEYALVGVGVNVGLDPSQHEEIHDVATSLAVESPVGAGLCARSGICEEPARESLLAALLNRFEALYLAARSNDGGVYEAWRARLETLGRQVHVQFGDRVDEGVAEDVDDEGNLILRRPDGSAITVSAGDVTLRTTNTL